MKRYKRSDRLGGWLWRFLVLAGLLGLIGTVILPDRDFSGVENRVLKTGISGTGALGSRVEALYSDQFVGRDQLFELGYIGRRLTGQKEINGVYIGRDLMAMETRSYDEAQMVSLCGAVRDFQARTGLSVTVEIVPDSAWVNQDKLPAFSPVADEGAVLAQMPGFLGESVGFVDGAQALESHKEEYLYYRTDHHWTSRGAFYGYCALAAAKGWDGTEESGYDVLQASGRFQGTLSSRTGNPFMKDSVDLWVARTMPEYMMEREDRKYPSMYVESALDDRDKYQVFTGSNTGVVTFEVDQDSDVRLLVFKDSFADSMMQFLIPQCRSVTMVDPRYFSGSLDLLLEEGMFTDVVFLYSYDSWMSDKSLAGLIS